MPRFLKRIFDLITATPKGQDSTKDTFPNDQPLLADSGTPSIPTAELDMQSHMGSALDYSNQYPKGHIRDRLRQQLCISKELATRVETSFPFVKHIRDDGIDTRNKVATCFIHKQQYYLKIADHEQGKIEIALLQALYEHPLLCNAVPQLLPSASGTEKGMITSLTSHPHILVDEQAMVYATVAEDTNVPITLENKLDVLARLHASDKEIERNIENYLQGKKLPRIDYGTVDTILDELQTGGILLSSRFAPRLRRTYHEAVQYLEIQQTVVLHKDPKDENWVAGGKILIDWAGACLGPRAMDYAKVLYDYAARDLLPEQILSSIASLYTSEKMYRRDARDVNTTVFHSLVNSTEYAGIICLTRMLRSNILKKRNDQKQQTEYYLQKLQELVDQKS